MTVALVVVLALLTVAVVLTWPRPATSAARRIPVTACWSFDRPAYSWQECAERQRTNHVAAATEIRKLRAGPENVRSTYVSVAAVRASVDACLSELIHRESRWNVTARNPTSGAYGLPQALPGSKMASAGPDWRTNAWTQVRWMRGYVARRYGGSCAALSFQKAHGYY